jgi:multidrug efflux pump subunit AcrA (membrane-fusion protein)
MNGWMRYCSIALILTIIALTQIGCGMKDSTDSSSTVVVEVKTTVVRSGEVEEVVNATGLTSPQRETQLRSPIAGVIISFKFFNGDAVKRGQTVAIIRTKESQAAIQGAEELLQSALSPPQKQEAQQALDLAQKTANDVTIKAPLDGVISNKLKNEMEIVAEGEEIATIIDVESIVFLADVPSSQLFRTKIGQPTHIRFPTIPGGNFYGVVKRIEPQVNPSDQTTRVWIDLTGDIPDLSSSLFGNAAIVVGKRANALLVPSAALLHNDETDVTSVMVVGPDSLAHSTAVSVGVVSDSVAEISSPAISPGEVVITEGHYGLPDSTRVRIVP